VALPLVYGRSSDRLSSIRQIGIGELNDKRALGVYLLIAFPQRAERTAFIQVASRKPSAIGFADTSRPDAGLSYPLGKQV
jgi:hypothetical protein